MTASDAYQGYLFLGVVVVAGIVALVRWRAAKLAREALRSVCREKGWRFDEDDPADRPSSYLGFKPFGQGHHQRATNVVQGDARGTPFEAFQYRYTTGSGKNQQTHTTVVAACDLPIEAPATLTIVRESVGLKVLDALGGEDIDVEDDAFSRRYWVKCGDRRFAYAVLDPRMIEYLRDRAQAWSIQWTGRRLVLHRNGTLRPPDALEAADFLAGFRATLPRMLTPTQHA
jgi:hypothetical protein